MDITQQGINMLNGIAHSPRILVIGDVMLDIYRIGNATRISPEAPVPVLLNPREEQRPGGAAAVASMCAALGAEVVLLSVTGKDRYGEILDEILESQGVTCLLLADSGRPTTVKERICGVSGGKHRQQLGRVDYESTEPIPPDISGKMAELITQICERPPDAIIISDYGKGVCVDQLALACREINQATGCPVFLDPPKGCDWPKYYGVTCAVPNREEAGDKCARDLCRQLQSEAAVVKLDSDGCELFQRHPDETWSIHARNRIVHDVTGAGDQFIAALACSRAEGLDWEHATRIANTAAGLQVERHGCVPVTIAELKKELQRDSARNQIEQRSDPVGSPVAAAAS